MPEMIFGLFGKKKKRPFRLDPATIEAGKEPFTLANAKAFYKKYMLENGYFDKDHDVSFQVELFGEAYKDSVSYAKALLSDFKADTRSKHSHYEGMEEDRHYLEVIEKWYREEKRKFLAEYIRIEVTRDDNSYPIMFDDEGGLPIVPCELLASCRVRDKEGKERGSPHVYENKRLIVRYAAHFTFFALDPESNEESTYRYGYVKDAQLPPSNEKVEDLRQYLFTQVI